MKNTNTEIIAIANRKGGSGKTTTAINLSVALAQQGKKILLIDLDPQANLTFAFGINDLKNGSMAHALHSSHPLLRDMRVTREQVDILPADKRLADVELELTAKLGRESILKKRLNEFSEYDFIFIDCPPSLGLLTINALNASTGVLVPIQMEVLSLQGLSQLFETIHDVREVLNNKLSIIGLIPFMYDSRRNLSAEILEEIQNTVKENIFKTIIRECVKIAEAPSFEKSVLAYAPNSHGAKDFFALATEFLELRR